ncbi:IS66 family insertion sequence element accessory protein TnpA [Dyella nitratireducens]|uniref:IS66 family insertion sequence element accessory protein TnpA n=1 Tax=Dyella nitratireducens TaxID=1849580 RepID=UPI0016666B93|nr:IS66 family insertion sequence element accessory protein TnpB [Dyella nitratireducens]
MASKQTYWTAHMDAWRQSGLSQAAYCKQQDLSLSSFGNWLHRRTESTSSTRAVPLVVAKPSMEASVEIRLPNGWSVRFSVDVESRHVLPWLPAQLGAEPAP